MKKLVLALCLTVVMAVPAFADNSGFYAGLKFIDAIQSTGATSKSGAANLFEIDSFTQNTIGGGIFVGYDLYPQSDIPIRAEVEYALRTNASQEWDMRGVPGASLQMDYNVQTLFLNVYWDFHNDSAFTPYIGAGAGMALVRTDFEIKAGALSDSGFETQSSFAWNVGLGCSYAFNDMLSLDLAYRFVSLGNIEAEKSWGSYGKVGMSPYANEFSLGVRFTF